MNVTIKGTVVEVREKQEFTSGFCKRELWLDSLWEKFPQCLSVEFTGKNVDLPCGLPQGAVVNVVCDIRGREANGRRYLSLAAWKVERELSEPVPTPPDEMVDVPMDCPF